MIIKRFLFTAIFCLLVFLISCNYQNDLKTNKKFNNINIIDVNPSEITTVKFSDIFKNFSIIPLQTSESCYLPEIEEILICKENFIIKTTKSIFIFKLTGEYITKIDQIGKGPSEHEYISDILIDEKNEHIEFIDFYNWKLLQYDLTGNFIKAKKLPFFVDAFIKIDNNHYFLYTTDPNNITDCKLNIYNFNKENVEFKSFPINTNHNEYLNFWKNTVFYNFDDRISFIINPFDTIYEINNDIKYRYLINFGNNKIPASFYNKKYSDILDFSQKSSARNYAYNIDRFYETDNFLFFQFKHKSKYKRAIYFKEFNKVKVVKFFIDDINSSNSIIKEHIWPKGHYNNKLIFAFEPIFLKEAYSELFKNDNKLIDSINLNNNPVLFIGQTK